MEKQSVAMDMGAMEETETMTKSEKIFVCRRCLNVHNTTVGKDPNEVLAICSECGTENWCLPVAGKKSAKKAGAVEKPPEPVEEVAQAALEGEANIEAIEAVTVEETEEEEQEVEIREEGPISEGLEQPDSSPEEPADVPKKGATKREVLIAKKRAELEELERTD